MPFPMPTDSASQTSHPAVLRSLVGLAERDPQPMLAPFQSLVSAYQYLPLYALVDRYLPTGGAVLDWGCGSGHFSFFLVRSGFATTAFSLEADDYGLRDRHAGDAHFHFDQAPQGDPTRLPYRDRQFDGVVSVGVLEHVREYGGDERLSLQEIHRILKPGGHFICYHFPNQGSWIEWLAARLPGKYHHPYRYTASDIRALCQEAGLHLRATRRYGFLPRNQWARLPRPLKNAAAIAQLWHQVDGGLSRCFAGLCQNHWFVAQKPTDSAEIDQMVF